MAFGLFVVAAIASIIPIFSGLSAFSSVPAERQAYGPESEIFLPGIYISYWMLIVAVVVALILAIYQVVSNPKGSIKALITVGVVAVAFFLLYTLADPKGTGSVAQTVESSGISDGVSKLIGGGLQLSIWMLLGSVVITILMEIWNYFKNQ